MESMRYAQVVVDIAHSQVDRIFDYLLPPQMTAQPGCRVRVPFARGEAEGFVLGISGQTQAPPEKLRAVLRVLDEEPIITGEQIKLAWNMVAKYGTTMTFALRFMFPAKMRGERVRERTVRLITLADEQKARALRAACFTQTGQVRAKNRLATLDKLLEAGECPAAVLDSVSVKKLLEAGICAERQAEQYRRPYAALAEAEKPPVTLLPEQEKAIRTIVESVAAGRPRTLLLHGVTGSGKTQVYIEAVRRTLAMGKSALVLVPEIALAPQLFGEFSRNFGDQIAVYHSGLSDGEKYDEWRRVRTGQARVAVGARSAVFLPLQDLGLIILDEEHEQSYRADNHPPYHAAEIAAMRSRLLGASVVLASATPLIEDYLRAQHGVYTLIEMPHRVSDLPLPAIEVVDMKNEFLRGNRSQISAALHKALEETLAHGEQALLFLNRRGYASSVICPTCGEVRMCPHCDVPLKYHRDREALLCHYCGRSMPFVRRCPTCGEPFVRLSGTGTQQLEEQIHHFFPQARTLRMDFDTTRVKDAHQRIYDAFKKGEADILIGTQMIARGLDFDRVSLAAVISADSMLSTGDFRAEERTFSMIEQVGGRAGRKKPGRVIVQTYNPAHYAVAAAKKHDYAAFYRQEIAYRRAACKPPFGRFYRLVFTAADAARAKKSCELAEKALKEMLKPFESDIILFVAKEAPVAKLDDKSRYHLLIKAKVAGNTGAIKKCVQTAAAEARGVRGVAVGFEIDPFEMN